MKINNKNIFTLIQNEPFQTKVQIQFSRKVLSLIKAIPKGEVATYGLIAKLAGNSRGSRGVGWLLHSCTKSHQLPWQRVIKATGKLPFPLDSDAYLHQKKLLEKEKIIVINGRVDLKKYLWKIKTIAPIRIANLQIGKS